MKSLKIAFAIQNAGIFATLPKFIEYVQADTFHAYLQEPMFWVGASIYVATALIIGCSISATLGGK